MHFLAENQFIVAPPETCEQAEIGQILSIQTVDLPEIEKLKMWTLRSPRIDIVDESVQVPISGTFKRNQSTHRKTVLGMLFVEVATLTNNSTMSDHSMAD